MTNEMAIFNRPELGDTFTSFDASGFDEKVALYNAINDPTERLANFINRSINVRDVIVRQVQFSKYEDSAPEGWADDGKAYQSGMRVILIDTQGVSYTATSTGIYNSICTLHSVFGTLHFPDGLLVTVNQIKTKNGNTLTLRIGGSGSGQQVPF